MKNYKYFKFDSTNNTSEAMTNSKILKQIIFFHAFTGKVLIRFISYT